MTMSHSPIHQLSSVRRTSHQRSRTLRFESRRGQCPGSPAHRLEPANRARWTRSDLHLAKRHRSRYPCRHPNQRLEPSRHQRIRTWEAASLRHHSPRPSGRATPHLSAASQASFGTRGALPKINRRAPAASQRHTTSAQAIKRREAALGSLSLSHLTFGG